MKTWKANWEESRKRYLDWWHQRGLIISMWDSMKKEGEPHTIRHKPPRPVSQEQFWFDPGYRSGYLDWQMSQASFMADILPVANTQLGPGSLGAILGASPECRDNSIWIRKPEEFINLLQPDAQNHWWQIHINLLKACKEKSQGNYFVGMPDLMEGLDVLASLKGTDSVLTGLILEPEKTMEWLQEINDIYFRVFDELYSIIQEEGEMAFCYFSIWGPGKVTKIQCDISSMISEEDFRTFVQPFLQEQCRKTDFTLYHLDGVDAIRHLDAVLEIEELNAVQWTPGVGEPQGGDPKWFPLYRKIISAGKSVMPCWVENGELQPLLDHVGPDGLNILMNFQSEKDVEAALKIADRYR